MAQGLSTPDPSLRPTNLLIFVVILPELFYQILYLL